MSHFLDVVGNCYSLAEKAYQAGLRAYWDAIEAGRTEDEALAAQRAAVASFTR
jgi:hypothetical protein